MHYTCNDQTTSLINEMMNHSITHPVNPEAVQGKCEEKKLNFVIVLVANNFAGCKPG